MKLLSARRPPKSKGCKSADLINRQYLPAKKGPDFEAVDYETGETVTVPLDVSRTPQETAQKLYKKISKLKTASAISRKSWRMPEEEDFLAGALHFTENAETPEILTISGIRLYVQAISSAPSKQEGAGNAVPAASFSVS